MPARIFHDVLTSRAGKKNQSASICITFFEDTTTVEILITTLTTHIKLKHLLANPSKKLQYRKFGITGFIDNINLKCSLRATEKYPYCLEYLLFISRYGFLKLNATYHF